MENFLSMRLVRRTTACHDTRRLVIYSRSIWRAFELCPPPGIPGGRVEGGRGWSVCCASGCHYFYYGSLTIKNYHAYDVRAFSGRDGVGCFGRRGYPLLSRQFLFCLQQRRASPAAAGGDLLLYVCVLFFDVILHSPHLGWG